ncbi:MAG: glycosyltransferase [Puniceicoccaceae bacterium]
MNIVYVSREFGPITGGGIGTYVANACRAMLERGHKVFLLTDCVNASNHHKLPENLHVVETLPMPAEKQGGCFSANHEYSHRVFFTLQELCRNETINVVEFPEYCGEGFVCIRSKRLMRTFADQHLVVKCHTPLSLLETINEDREFAAWVVCDMEMEDYCVRNADKVTSPSQSLADYFSDRVGRNDISICPYPLYLDFSEPTLPMAKRDLKTIRFFGSIQVRKGVDVFVRAAVEVLEKRPDLQFELVGVERNAHFFNRTYTEVLQSTIPEKMLNRIQFRGGVPYDQVDRLLSETGIIVLPSRWENWANACLESMSKGCVVLASRSGGMSEMIETDHSGMVIDPKNASALAGLLLELLEDESRLQRISNAAVARARELTHPTTTALRMEANYTAVKERSFSDQNDKPLVSVVIPFFNQATTLSETLESVRSSNYPELEIVVVNDGSTSPAAKRCFDSLEGVVKVEQCNRGLSAARNAGIRASKGKYVLPLDSDDLLHPEYLNKAVTALESCPDLGYVSCYTRNFGAFDTPYYPIGYVSKLMPYLNTSGKCTNLYRRELFNITEGYDECMNSYEDWDFLLTLEDAGVEGDILPEELFYYRRNFASMVFSTANPIRANLIQYMMLKHRKSWASHSEMIALLLVRLWKEAEMREESSNTEEFRVYFGGDDGLSEKGSKEMHYIKFGRVQIECTLPFDPKTHTVRFDFAVSEMRILIHRVWIKDLLSERLLLEFDSEKSWEGLDVAGTAMIESGDDAGSLCIRSTGVDPQVIVQSNLLLGAELQVGFEFEIV